MRLKDTRDGPDNGAAGRNISIDRQTGFCPDEASRSSASGPFLLFSGKNDTKVVIIACIQWRDIIEFSGVSL